MSKITLNSVGSLIDNTTAETTVNSNFSTIQTAIDNTLSRDGTSPNQMQSNLDMNGLQIVNLPTPATNNSPLRLQDLNTFNHGGTISTVPAGGTTGQGLTKHSNTDYDMQWSNVVTSVGMSLPADFTVTGSPVTSTGTLTANWANSPTGTGAVVRQAGPIINSPTLTTPSLGSAVATTVNKVTITAPATAATLTIADNKILTANNTLTLSGTDGASIAFQSSDTYVGRATTDTLTNKTIDTAGPNTLKVNGNVLSASAGSATVTIPNATDTLVGRATTDTLSNKTIVPASNTLGWSINPGGRLTTSSGGPIMTTTNAGQTTLFYTPYQTDLVPIYNGTNMIMTQFTELSQLTTDATKSPAAVAASSVYDIFVWNDSGTLRATRGPAWTNSSTRGYTLTRQNGLLLNTSSITNGPAALRGTWVGTIQSNASSQIDWIYGGTGIGGVAASHQIWNAYNRVHVATTTSDTTAGYTYTSNTVRQAKASTGNQINFIVGAREDAMFASMQNEVQTVATAGSFGTAGLGINTTTAFTFGRVIAWAAAAASQFITCSQSGYFYPNLGSNFISSNEAGDNTHANTFDSGAANYLSAELVM